ncbi:MAG: lysophospholipase [Proteobacteria bacterium]|nr:MAG: lysophospholipase [Pseudomonadota bacterium]PIE40298.1 MAG: lysophospholipase [Gammaproteobacteria bacterium]
MQWNKKQIVTAIRPFSLEGEAELTKMEQEYCFFYGIDFYRTLPGVTQRLGFFSSLGFKVVMHYFSPSDAKGTVLVMHGYFDHVGLYRHLIRFLLQKGYAVVCYDQPGHGLSSGDEAAIKSFAHYQAVLNDCLNIVKSNLVQPLHAIGQSTGAAVLIDYYLAFGLDQDSGAFDRVILLAPLVRPVGWKAALRLHALLRPFFTTWKRDLRKNTGDSQFLRFLHHIDPLQSKTISVAWVTSLKRWIPRIESSAPVDMELTVIQGEEDGTVDWRHNLIVLNRKFRKTQVYYLPKAEHHLVNESPEIREKMLDIIKRVFDA